VQGKPHCKAEEGILPDSDVDEFRRPRPSIYAAAAGGDLDLLVAHADPHIEE